MTDKEIKAVLKAEIPKYTSNYREFIFSDAVYAYMAGRFSQISIARAFDIVSGIRIEILDGNQEERASA